MPQDCSWGQSIEHQTTVDGVNRKYYVYVPQHISQKELYPLIVVLHGGGGNHRHAERISGMSQQAEKRGFVVAYPDGSGRLESMLTWNANHCCGHALQLGTKDVLFIGKMIDQIADDYPVDRSRIYVTGMSNGAMLTYQIGIALSNKIAAIAPVVGAMFGDESRPAEAISVVIFNGVDDRHVPFDGGYSTVERVERNMDKPYQSAMITFNFWADTNHCNQDPQVDRAGNVERISAQGCPEGAEVILYKLHGAGHAWPGGEKGSRWGDEPTHDISATDVMIDFFMRHSKPSTKVNK